MGLEGRTFTSRRARRRPFSAFWLVMTLVVVLALGALSYGGWALLSDARAREAADAAARITLSDDGEYKSVAAQDLRASGDEGSPSVRDAVSNVNPDNPADSTEADEGVGSSGVSGSKRPGEDDPGLHVLSTDVTEAPEISPEDTKIWPHILSGSNGKATVPEDVSSSWECHGGQADPKMGQVDWEQARAVEGPAIFVPSVCMVSPMITTGVRADAQGNEQLELPSAPWSTRYDESAPWSASEGNTYVASHVNYRGFVQFGPFKQLEAVSMGAPILVRDEAGQWHLFETVDRMSFKQNQAVEDPQIKDRLFRLDGDRTLTLVTCMVGESGRYDTNRVLVARKSG